MTHPARFSTEIIEVVRELLQHRAPTVVLGEPMVMLWDPFAGSGERLAGLAESLCLDYGGTEIEPSFIVDDRIVEGDATDPLSYPHFWPHIIFTSPVYPNGIADSWKMSDGSKRITYRAAIGEIEGADRELHPNNQGRYGYRGTNRHGKSTKRTEYWRIADEAVACWSRAELVILNVSDFKHSNGEIEPLVEDWRTLLRINGWVNQTVIPVATKRMRNGSNADQRVDVECVVVAEQ